MKQKYKLMKDSQNLKFTIQEYTDIDGEMPSLLCKEIYDLKKLRDFCKKPADLSNMIRTINMFPPTTYMKRITDTVFHMLSEQNNNQELTKEIKFNDKEMNMEYSQIDQDINSSEDSVNIDQIIMNTSNKNK